MHDVIIVGAGAFGREVYAWLSDNVAVLDDPEYQVKGFLEADPEALAGFDVKVRVIGDESSYQVEADDRFIIAIGNIDSRKRVVEALSKRKAHFVSLVHRTAVIADTAKLGQGCVVCPFVTISCNVQVGDWCLLNLYSSCGHDSRIGQHCILSPYATLNGFAVLEDEVFVGTHATVAGYRRIGYRAKISANSAAMYDAPPYSFVCGVPGRNRIIFRD